MKNSSIMRSKLLRRGLLPIFFVIWVAVLLSLSGSRVSSQSSEPTQPPQARNDEVKPVSRLVDDAKRAGGDFQIVEPFNRQTRSAAALFMLLPTNEPTQTSKAMAGYQMHYSVWWDCSCIIGPQPPCPSLEGQWLRGCDGEWISGWGWKPFEGNCRTWTIEYGESCP